MHDSSEFLDAASTATYVAPVTSSLSRFFLVLGICIFAGCGDPAASSDTSVVETTADASPDTGDNGDTEVESTDPDAYDEDAVARDTVATHDTQADTDDRKTDTIGPQDTIDDTGTHHDTAEPFDCSAISDGPFSLTPLSGPVASEDLAFDADGHLVGADDQAIFRSRYNASPKVWVPAFTFRAGLRFLPNGHLIVADDTRGELVRVSPDGVRYPFVTGLSYPNGLAVDLDGWVFFSEHDSSKVWRVHPFTGERTLVTAQIANPNGLAFSPDYRTLYIGGFNGDPTVHAVSISETGMPGRLYEFASGVGSGWHDGLGVDICGNVYITDYNETKVWRVDPDGQNPRVILDGSLYPNAYIPNLQWGSGIGGWSRTAIYLPDGWAKGVFEVEIGVPGAPLPYP
ncbi:MAG: sugar lactone lactonase YvrE [Myxococcota bacterium]